MTDTTSLTAGRETDKLVAEALGWKDLHEGGDLRGFGLIGVPLGEEKPVLVPAYSTTTAALLALEEMQRRVPKIVAVDFEPHDPAFPEPYTATLDGIDFYSATTLWLAICKLIVATAPKEQEQPTG